jgi:hypothetical protein
MPAKKPPAEDEKPQRERFLEAAREAGVDETSEAFERAFARIVPPKRATAKPRATQTQTPIQKSRPRR